MDEDRNKTDPTIADAGAGIAPSGLPIEYLGLTFGRGERQKTAMSEKSANAWPLRRNRRWYCG